MIKKILLIILFACFTQIGYAEEFSISIYPAKIIQGDPVLVQINNATKISDVKKITFENKKWDLFLYKGVVSALLPVDLNKKAGDYKITVGLKNGETLTNTLTVNKRDVVEEPLGIPEKLGGNTKQAQDKLVQTLAADKKKVTNLKTNKNTLWSKNFLMPLKDIYITSPYGYSRKTGEYSIPHKGTDYRAPDGTEVYAINRGVVRIAKSYRDYGKSIFIDHGQGLVSYYLHLSKYKVYEGQVVERGQVIGLAGHTGYAIGAHLHLGIRIHDITIDPEKFFELFK